MKSKTRQRVDGLVTMFLFGAATGLGFAASTPGEIVWFDFEAPDALDGWEARPGADLSITEDWSTEGPRTRWNPNSIGGNRPGNLTNGDGTLLYPGPNGPLSLIRLENFRDGLEDYEYHAVVRRLLEAWSLPESEADVPPEVVAQLKDFTHDPDVIEGERERLAKRILQLQEITEGSD